MLSSFLHHPELEGSHTLMETIPRVALTELRSLSVRRHVSMVYVFVCVYIYIHTAHMEQQHLSMICILELDVRTHSAHCWCVSCEEESAARWKTL